MGGLPEEGIAVSKGSFWRKWVCSEQRWRKQRKKRNREV